MTAAASDTNGAPGLRIVVRKGAGTLEVWQDGTVLRRLACGCGRNPGDKEREGDARTPVGAFRVVYRNPESLFHLSLGLSYPEREDADRGLAAGLITPQHHAAIHAAHDGGQVPDWYTPLGGEIMIHGGWDGQRGTAGCVAVSNPDIEWLYERTPIGTVVEIHE